MSTNATDPREPPASGLSRSGFHGQIKGASLSDLVQMECLAGSHGVVEVTSVAGIGRLFFRGGDVVHATVGPLVGEAAALEMLAWTEGTFRPVEGQWPSGDSIVCTWQALVLRAAQLQDERQAREPAGERREPISSDKRKPDAMHTVAADGAWIELGDTRLRGEDFQLVLRLSADGEVASNRGATDEFADIVAYACRLGELIGVVLGVERLLAMECTFKTGRCFVVLKSDGEVLALGPKPSADLRSIRERLGV